MEWMKANSVEELKKIGKLREVKKVINKDLREITGNSNVTKYIELGSRSWKDQLRKICELNRISDSFQSSRNKEEDSGSLYFKDEASEYIFYLLELDGQARMDKLKIYKSHYRDKEEARRWRDRIAKIIHPDKIKTLAAAKAMEQLNSIYNNMVNDE